MSTTPASAYFAASYAEAREKFLASCQREKLIVRSYPHARASGPAGEPLFTDVARAGPADAARVLVMISGTHGVEGFCGSACQVGLLAERALDPLPRAELRRPRGARARQPAL